VVVSSARDITAAVRPPRAVFTNFPLGHNIGAAFDTELQDKIVRDALTALTTLTEPGMIVELPYTWPENPAWESRLT